MHFHGCRQLLAHRQGKLTLFWLAADAELEQPSLGLAHCAGRAALLGFNAGLAHGCTMNVERKLWRDSLCTRNRVSPEYPPPPYPHDVSTKNKLLSLWAALAGAALPVSQQVPVLSS